MSKTILIKLKRAGSRTGPFDIFDDHGNTLGTNIPKSRLISGISYIVDDNVKVIVIKSVGVCNGKCKTEVRIAISSIYQNQLASIVFQRFDTASLWRHLTNPLIYNYYYGNIDPYIVEYPYAYQ